MLSSGIPTRMIAHYHVPVQPLTPSLACPLQSMEAGPKVTVLPVVDGGRLQGLVTLHDLVSAGL